MDKDALEKKIRSSIPLSQHMGFRVLALDKWSITVAGGAEENLNLHQTAFAGSLYSICTLAAWGLTFSKLPADCTLVMASAQIEYLRPVKGKIIATAKLAQQQIDDLLSQLQQRGKAKLALEVLVENPDQIAVRFTAHLHVKQQ